MWLERDGSGNDEESPPAVVARRGARRIGRRRLERDGSDEDKEFPPAVMPRRGGRRRDPMSAAKVAETQQQRQ